MSTLLADCDGAIVHIIFLPMPPTRRLPSVIFAALVASALHAQIGDPLAAKREEALGKNARAAKVEPKVAPREGPSFSPSVLKSMPATSAPAPARTNIVRPADWLPPDLSPLLTDAFRFSKGVRFTALLAGRTVMREDVKAHDPRVRLAFDELYELLEAEDPTALEHATAQSDPIRLDRVKESIAFDPSLSIELQGSRPLLVFFDFHSKRAIVEFNGLWSSRSLPDKALDTLLPAVGSRIFSFIEAEAKRRR
jgi:hypothetical protein